MASRPGRTARALALTCTLLSLPLTIAWLMPSWPLLHPIATIASMFIPLMVITWPLAALSALIALARSRLARDGLIALVALIGTALVVVNQWPYLNAVARPETAPQLRLALVHARAASDIDRVDQLVANSAIDVVVLVGLTEEAGASLAANARLNATLPNQLLRPSTAVLSATPVTATPTAETSPIIWQQDVGGSAWHLAAVDLPTPIEDAPAWVSRSQEVLDAVAPLRSSPLVVVGDFGNNRFTKPLLRASQLGLSDARADTATWWAPTWPLDSRVRPILTTDHALTAGGVHASDYTRLAWSNDDYLGLVVGLARR